MSDLADTSAPGVAIVGMSGRFPGASDLERFWANLRDGVESITFFPEAGPAVPGYVPAKGILDDIEGFDASFFGIPPLEAELMDPQHRLFLECAWEALEEGGCTAAGFRGVVGAFAGCSMSAYLLHALGGLARELSGSPMGLQALIGNDKDYLATLAAYKLGLEGPCVSVQTACSTSLVAVAMACQSLLLEECDAALAGGVTLRIPQRIGYLAPEGGVLSPDGHCRAFDVAAQGTTLGSGVGVVLLKRLEDALEAGDRIHAVIRGWATNNDGARRIGFTAPGLDGQAEVIASAHEFADVSPDSVSYVEAHGSGTPLGDSIEIAALTRAFRKKTSRRGFCGVGSVKTNVGHLECAAGVTGLIKVALMLRHRELVPSLHFQTPNPRIEFQESPFHVVTRHQPWRSQGGPLRAGISSFGIGGTNAHLIVEEPPQAPRVQRAQHVPASWALPLSAPTPEALREQAERHARHLEGLTAPEELPRVCAASALRRKHHAHRLVAIGSQASELVSQLRAWAREGDAPGVHAGKVESSNGPVFVFSGQGGHAARMGHTLAQQEPVFREALRRCDEALRPHLGCSIIEELGRPAESSRLQQVELTQPAIFAIQVALAALWRAWGVQPSAVLGHSMGEVAAAHVAGALELADAARVIAVRSKLASRLSGQGGMVLLDLTASEADALARSVSPLLSVSAHNGPRTTVVSGPPESLESLMSTAAARGIFCRRLPVDFSAHGPQVEPLLGEMTTALAGLRPKAPTVPMISSVTAALIDRTPLDARYWASNLRNTVLFTEAVDSALTRGSKLFLELAPHPLLSVAIQEQLQGRGGRAIGSLQRDVGDRQAMLEALAQLHVAGVPVGWSAVQPLSGPAPSLPTYAWQRRPYWYSGASASTGQGSFEHGHSGPEAGQPRRFTPADRAGVHYREWVLDPATLAELRDHRIAGTPTFPGSAFLVLALQAAREELGGSDLSLRDIEFQRPLRLAPPERSRLQLVLEQDSKGETTFHFSGRADGVTGSEAWVQYARGRVVRESLAGGDAPDLEGRLRQARVRLSADAHYGALVRRGLDYRESFHAIEQLGVEADGGVARLASASSHASALGPLPVSPGQLDSAMQVCAALLHAGPDTPESATRTFVPVSIASFSLGRSESAPDLRWSCFQRRHGDTTSSDSFEGDITLHAASGVRIGSLTGLRLHALAADTGSTSEGDFFEVRWVPQALTGSAPLPLSRRWLILSDRTGFGERLAARLESEGGRCTLVPSSEEGRAALEQALAERFDDIIHLGSLGSEAVAMPDASGLRAAIDSGCGALVDLVRLLSSRAHRSRLWVVTERSQATVPGDVPSPVSATVWGLGRTLPHEHPELSCRRIDLDDPASPALLSAVLDELRQEGAEDEIALRGSRRFVSRLVSAQPHTPAAEVRFDARGTYLITGGLGGIGLELAHWLADRGATTLALLGRTPASERAQARLEALRLRGITVHVALADVSDPEALSAALRRIRSGCPPLRGVFHAAGVLDDDPLRHLDRDRFWKVLAPKLAGALHLDRLTRDDALESLVLFSSTASVLGSPGQGNYAAANQALDALAHARRARGTPAISVNWGAWAEVGLAAARFGMGDGAALRGIAAVSPAQGLAALGRILAWNPVQVASLRFHPSSWVAFHSTAARAPRLAPVLGDAVSPASAQATASTTVSATGGFEAIVAREVARVLRIPEEQLDARQPLGALGLSSLMGLELRNRLQRLAGVPLPATLLWNHPTIAALAESVEAMRGKHLSRPPEREAAAPAPLAPEPTPPRPEPLSREELAQALAQELAAARKTRTR
ncbi:type I polyketide synthase [Hyalangium gracile]|uniref:type I polyketide synthase n=1 Tax=Hyalangium gracile TaxID=394092 RepID=UPI001CCC635A|nr:type I polyketide synthase [Hyalangium gracile]